MTQLNEQQNKQSPNWYTSAMCCGASDCETSKRLNVHGVRKQKKFTPNIKLTALRTML